MSPSNYIFQKEIESKIHELHTTIDTDTHRDTHIYAHVKIQTDRQDDKKYDSYFKCLQSFFRSE